MKVGDICTTLEQTVRIIEITDSEVKYITPYGDAGSMPKKQARFVVVPINMEELERMYGQTHES